MTIVNSKCAQKACLELKLKVGARKTEIKLLFL
jgi:hypothetical protein